MKIGLVGNPNTGKTSLFNMLTGMRQHVGNFPGVTVDKKSGTFETNLGKHELIDFPGTYSVFPRSKDEEVVYNSLSNPESELYPDAIIVVADASNLERNLLYVSQIYDLNLPTLLVLNMSDVASRKGIELNISAIEKQFPELSIVQTNARIKSGKNRIADAVDQLKKRDGHQFLEGTKIGISEDINQEEDTQKRLDKIKSIFSSLIEQKPKEESFTHKLDKILLHPILGYLIFGAVLLLIFQFIFSFSTIPMDFIDESFGHLSELVRSALPEGLLNDLLTEGIIPGIGGVVIFIPQIAILFFFLSILEETGYLSRVVFLMDRLMKPFGLNGRSVVPLMSSVACAIPGVMAARTISNWKERMTTIMVAPLMSCTARLPVYTVLISLVVPNDKVGGFNLQGLVMMGMYLLGIVSALFIAWIMQKFTKSKSTGFLLMEMPEYKSPRWKNVGLEVWEKVRVFVWDAGRIIIAISIVLWATAKFGPSDRIELATKSVLEQAEKENWNNSQTERALGSAKLENSYIGILGHAIEPAIKPLGYDWKIGISLITSFAAREVFVGSMATIYAVEESEEEENKPLLDKMRDEKWEDGTPVYSRATGFSLLIFYAFAMQCMATLAVVKRETKSWKWPIIQLVYMGILAYLGAWITYTVFS